MSIEAIAAVGVPALDPGFIAPLAAPEPAGFGNWFAQEVGSVDARIGASERSIEKLAVGDAPSLHEVMINMEEAKLAFQLLAQVRNRLLEAYQEVMRMQV